MSQMVKKGLSESGAHQPPTLESTTRELEHVRFALDQSAILAATDRAGRIIHVNDKFCEISKYAREELIGENHRLISSGHHDLKFFEVMWKTISGGQIWEGEIKNRAKDGTHYWVNTTIVPFLDAKGSPYQYVAIRYDITQRKAAEQQLRIYADRLEIKNLQLQEFATIAAHDAVQRTETLETLRKSEETLRSLFDATFEGIVVHDLDGNIRDVNEAAAKIFDCTRSEMLGTSILRYFDNGDPERSLETEGRRKDGTTVCVEVRSKPYVYQGESVRLITIWDISSRKELEAQILMQDRLASVGLLASSLAHEIGTPLGVIRGRAEYLGIQTRNDPKIQKNVDVIISQIDRVSKLIRSLLNLARGEQIRSADEIHLNLIVSEVIEVMGHELKKGQIEIRNEVPTDSVLKVNAEAGPLHQVLLNLLVNSVHAIGTATKQGRTSGHFIRVSARDEGEQWALRIEDTGCGISSENMRNLFKPFFTTKDIGVGTGLGLATCYRIVETWGGSIQAHSEEGSGTVFQILLPKARVAPAGITGSV